MAALRSSSSVMRPRSLDLGEPESACAGRLRPPRWHSMLPSANRPREQESRSYIGGNEPAVSGEHDAILLPPDESRRRELLDHRCGGGRDRRAAPRAQGEGTGLFRPRRRLELLRTGDGGRSALDGGDVALRRAHVPPAPARVVPVRGAADAEVLALAPIEKVVAALFAGARPVRHLVPLEAGRAEQ